MQSLKETQQGNLMDLRPYQVNAIESLRKAMRGGSMRPILQLPTGAGKTVIAAEIIKMAR